MLAGARFRRLQLRPGFISRRSSAAAAVAQRRCLNHFISEVPPTTDHVPPPPSNPSSSSIFRLAIKDNIATTTLPTTCASPFLTSYTSPFEASIVTQLLRLGASIVGKTNLDEFGMGSHSVNSAHGSVVSPLSTTAPLSAGGSSGGSAAAVAAGEADIALGTDTGGSVRLPAAYTGVVGYKPSYGMISRWGVVPYANSLDTVGFLARDVTAIRELVISSGLYKDHDARDPTSLFLAARRRCTASRQGYAVGEEMELKGLTFGIPTEYNISELDPRIRAAWIATVIRLQNLGARVVPVSLPSTRHALSAYYVIAPAEASSNLAKYDGVRYGKRDNTRPDGAGETLYSSTRGAGFGEEVRRRILLGSYTLSSEAMDNYFIQAQRVRRLVRRDFDRVFRLANPLVERETFDLAEMDDSVQLENKLGPTEVDFLLCPTAPTLPPTLEEVETQEPVDGYMNDVFTVPASLAGLPAVSVPVKIERVEEGEVDFAGLQVIGQYWDDARVLGVAEVIAEGAD
ncbi:amidase signature domain-containing protein [Coniochaeta sp. 2T2.1]|nr:amidase signature domain-containing protein [Coniochaeta sp. 2T2.1]